ncbi:MAG: MalY/PatB family protein [Christensenellales bacterium]|jgi:cystathionine beta-lyase
MKFDAAFFDRPLNRYGTDSRKWEQPGLMQEGFIPLWVADMDFVCAPAISEALTKRAQHPNYGYTILPDSLIAAIRGFWQRRHGVTVKPEELCFLPSVVTGLRMAVKALSQPGDKVAIFTPIYGPFFAAIKESERQLVELPLIKGNNYRYTIDFAKVENAFKQGVKLLMLCSPHNPISRIWTKEELVKLCDLCNKYQVKLACDEIHNDFIYQDHPFIPILALEQAPSDTLCLAAPSKTFNVAGLQLAYMISRDTALMETTALNMRRLGIERGNIFSLVAAKAAYEHGDEWLDGLIVYLDQNRKHLADYVKTHLPLAKLTPIECTYLAWLDISAYETDDTVLEEKLKTNKVAFTMGYVFSKELGKNHLRINFGCPKAQLLAGLERLKNALIS